LVVGVLIARGRAELGERIVRGPKALLVLRNEGGDAHVVQDYGVVHAALEGLQESRELRLGADLKRHKRQGRRGK
jgi:hypothetical protein